VWRDTHRPVSPDDEPRQHTYHWPPGCLKQGATSFSAQTLNALYVSVLSHIATLDEVEARCPPAAKLGVPVPFASTRKFPARSVFRHCHAGAHHALHAVSRLGCAYLACSGINEELHGRYRGGNSHDNPDLRSCLRTVATTNAGPYVRSIICAGYDRTSANFAGDGGHADLSPGVLKGQTSGRVVADAKSYLDAMKHVSGRADGHAVEPRQGTTHPCSLCMVP